MPVRLPTTIPIGSPHIAKPPVFEPWRWNTGRGEHRERRDYARRLIARDVWLIDLESQSVLRCKTDDVSDAGLSATAPVGFGLGVGQRYEVRIAPSRTAAMTPHLAASLGYATIVRSGIQVSDDRPDRVGFAVRFDVPQLIPV